MQLFGIVFLVGIACAARLENTYLPPGSAKTAGGNGQFLRTPFNGQQLNNPQLAFSQIPSSGTPKFNIPSPAYGSPIHANSHIPNYDLQKPLTPVQANSFDIYPQKSLTPSPVYGPANFRSNNPEARANTIHADNTNDGSGSYHFGYETENKISQTEEGQLKQVSEGEATVVQGSYSYTGDDGKVYTVNYIADENGFQPSGEHIDQIVSMTAADAAKKASVESQQGYTYNAQQNNYNSQQKGYNGYQQRYSSPQQGFNTHQEGFVTPQQGFNTQQQGFNPQQQGFNPQQQGFIANQPGLSIDQQAIDANQQGLNKHSLLINSQQGFNAQRSQIQPDNGGYRY